MSSPVHPAPQPCADQSTAVGRRPPGEPFVGALAGAALLLLGHRRGGRVGLAAELIGAGLVANALAPAVEGWLLRSGSARRRLSVRCELEVERSVSDVFEFCRNFENFPRVMAAVESVTDFEDGRSHWTVRTAAGRRLEWNAIVTKYVPRSVIAWHSVPGSQVDTGGLIRFTALDDGVTRLEIELSYHPCATDLREAVFALLEIAPARVVAAELESVPELLRRYPVPVADDATPDPEEAAEPPRVATSPVTPGAAMPREIEHESPPRSA